MPASKAVRRIVASCVGLAVAVVMACPTVVAQSSWTTGDGGNGLFSNTLNWTSGTAPVAGSSLVFGATSGTTALTNDLSIAGNNPLWAGITFNSGAPAYTISGSAMTMAASSAITNNSTSTQTFSNAFAISSPLTMAASSGGLTFSGVLSGAGSITKTGTGTLTLSGNNTYTGLTTVSAGLLSLSGTSNIGNMNVGGSSTLTVTGGTTTVNATTANPTTSNTLFGGAAGSNTALQINGGVLNIQGAGAWVAFGDNGGSATFTLTSGTYSNTTQWGQTLGRTSTSSSGTVTINGGMFRVAGSSASGLFLGEVGTGVVNLNGGVLQVDRLLRGTGTGMLYLNGGTLASTANSGTNFMTGLTGAFVQSGGAIVDTTSASVTIAQNLLTDAVSTGGGLTKVGANTLTLTGTNTYTGTTRVNAGTLQIGNGTRGEIATVSGVVVGSSGTLALNMANGVTLGNAITNNGVMNFIASGSTVYSGNMSGTGAINQRSGSLALSGTNNIGNFVVTGSSVLTINGGTTTINATASGQLGNTRFGSALGDNVTVQMTGGALNVQGAGAWIAFGDYGAATTFNLSSGTYSDTTQWGVGLGRSNAASAGTLNINGGQFYVSGAGTNGIALGVLNEGAAGSGVINLNGGLLKVDRLQRTGGTGTFYFNGGTLASTLIANSTTFMQGLTAAYVKSGGAIIDTTDRSVTIGQNLLADAVSTGGGLTKLGVNTLTLSGSNTYSGDTRIGAGTLAITNANALLNSTLNLNAADAGAVTFSQNSTLGGLTGSRNLDMGTRTLSIGNNGQSTIYSGVLSNGALTKAGVGTLALTGNNTYSGLTTISGGTLAVGNGGTSGALAGNVLNNAALVFHRSDATTFANAISGSGLVRLLGGSLTLSGSNSFSGGTLIDGGTLLVNGSLASGVAAAANTMLGGSGVIGGTLSGAGLVSPGNSPGILAANVFDPTNGLDAAFEFTAFAPNYTTSGTGALNDVLRLTSGTPFVSDLTNANTIDIYFNVDSIANGDIFEGGFFTGLSAADLLTDVQGATFRYWIKDNSGGTPFGGVNYSSLTSLPGITGITVNTVSRTANFGGGDVTGSVTQFIVVPEPGAIALAGVGVAIAGWARVRRRRGGSNR